MTARESVKNFDEQLDKYSSYVAEQIGTVIGKCGGRPSGYPEEHKAQDYVMDHMKDVADQIDKPLTVLLKIPSTVAVNGNETGIV